MRTLLLISPPGFGRHHAVSEAWRNLPPLTLDELGDTTDTYVAAGLAGPTSGGREVPLTRPFRAPHHTCSVAALFGDPRATRSIWGPDPRAKTPIARLPYRRPGEVDLARHGVLLLDEAPEFRAGVIADVLRGTRNVPGWLVLTATPCACGYHGTTGLGRTCACTDGMLARWRARLDALIALVDTHHTTTDLITHDALRAAQLPGAAPLHAVSVVEQWIGGAL